MAPNIVLTEDGSLTCREPLTGELYHNRAGAYTEALDNYVKTCDITERIKKQNKIVILDSCFGLGYNSFVFIDRLLQCLKENKFEHVSCHIVGIDKDSDIINLLPQVLAQPQFYSFRQTINFDDQTIKQMVNQLHQSAKYNFNVPSRMPLSVFLELKFADIRQVVLDLVSTDQKFDYIFHDGFSPRVMPELWTVDLFSQYSKLLKDSGRIVTYSSAYAVRGALKECGLEIRKTIALGDKSGGTIAFKKNQPEIVDNQNIFFLSQEESARLLGRSGIPYRDPSLKDTGIRVNKHRAQEMTKSTLPVNKSNGGLT